MPAEGMKWRVNRAVKRSTLPPPSRLVMFVLSDRADAKTAVIPSEHSPSVSELAEETGLSEATMKRHLAALEASGWVARERPTAEQMARHVPGTYRLMIGQGVPNDSPGAHSEPPEEESEGSQRTPAGGSEETPETDPGAQSEPTGGSERTPAGAQSEPPSYKNDRYDQYNQLPGADAHGDDVTGTLFDAHPAETAQSRSGKKTRGGTRKQAGELKPPSPADELTNAFWAKHGKGQAQSWVAIRGVLRTCLANEVPRDDLARALDLLANEETSISGGTIQNALKRLRQSQNGRVVPLQRANGHVGFQDSQDKDYSLDGYLAQRNGA